MLVLSGTPEKKDAIMLQGALLISCEAADGARVPEEIQFLPYGYTVTDKGDMLVDEQSVQELLSFLSAKKNDIVIDYEHQTLKDVEAPAAGWIKEFIDKKEQGLWCRVDWTPRAQEYLKNKEYRYLSPVIWARNSDKRVVFIHSAALTNTPSIDGMEPIVNKRGQNPAEEADKVLKALICKKLGLPEDATDEQIQAALDKVLTAGNMVANKEILSLLDLGDNATIDQAKGKIIALKNPTGYVKAEDYNELKKRLDLRDRDDLVQMALKSGKVAPAQKEWAEEYALKDPAGFRAFLENAPQVVPLEDISGHETRQSGQAGGKIGDSQLLINKQLGISEEEFKKFGGEQ